MREPIPKRAKHFYSFGPYRLYLAERELFCGPDPVALTPKALETLLLLLGKHGHVVEKDELMSALWPDTFVEEANLVVQVSQLRKVLGEGPGGGAYIATVPKRGYRFAAPVTESWEEEPADTPLTLLASRNDAGVVGRRRLVWSLAVVSVFVIAAGVWLLLSRRGAGVPEASLKAVPLTSFQGIEICPSFSPDGNQAAFSWNGENQDNFDVYIQIVGSGRPVRLTDHPSVDAAPAWSPDGKQIAFLRGLEGNQSAVMLIPSLGGRETLLAGLSAVALDRNLSSRRIAWHPGGKHLAVTDGDALFLLSTETGKKHRLTTPPKAHAHLHPAFSPDGRSVVFSQQIGYVSNLYQLALDETLAPRGEPVQLTAETAWSSYPVWTTDGHEIIFARSGLWRMAVSGSGKPQRLVSLGEDATHPALSRDGRRLAYARMGWDTNIYRIEVSASGTATPDRAPLIASTRLDAIMQFSPDGSKIAFQSNRSGTNEIWVCDSDGSNCVQVTNMGGSLTGTPRWSPDGQQIVFDSRPEGHSDVFIVRAGGGKPRPLTTDPAEDNEPSWSRDGRWIYFMSKRSGTDQVWKIPAVESARPGEAVRVTRNGGVFPFESHDGKLVYYVKQGGVWQVPVEGGVESQVIESVRSGFSYAVADKGIYFIPSGETEVRFFDFNSRAIRTVASIPALGESWQSGTTGHLAVSPDGRTILYSQNDTAGSDLMLVENFR